jgi:hypothetical protein
MSLELEPTWDNTPHDVDLDTKSSDALCDVCFQINWAEVLERWNVFALRRVVPSMVEMQQHHNCPLCRLWIRAQRSLYPGTSLGYPEDEPQRVDIYSRRDFVEQVFEFLGSDPPEQKYKPLVGSRRITRLRLVSSDETKVAWLDSGNVIEAMLHTDNVFRDEMKYGSGQFIPSTQIDTQIFHHWLAQCEEDHEDCHRIGTWENLAPALKKNGRFRVIDVDIMQVRPAQPGCKYVCLSYVWGDVESFDRASQTFSTTMARSRSHT